MDEGDNVYMFEKDRLRSFSKSRTSMMPAYDTSLLSEKDLQDIVAYLVSVQAR
jgi:mono/diheme cytochrome c family protein